MKPMRLCNDLAHKAKGLLLEAFMEKRYRRTEFRLMLHKRCMCQMVVLLEEASLCAFSAGSAYKGTAEGG